ncbi:LamB/YcsF family protein, partial [Pseudomonas aeruginosa]|nr:LamB/YcsF family protein [Pseudomonas aeruginosa]
MLMSTRDNTFGRRSLACSAQEVEDLLLYQIGALDGLCRAEG